MQYKHVYYALLIESYNNAITITCPIGTCCHILTPGRYYIDCHIPSNSSAQFMATTISSSFPIQTITVNGLHLYIALQYFAFIHTPIRKPCKASTCSLSANRGQRYLYTNSVGPDLNQDPESLPPTDLVVCLKTVVLKHFYFRNLHNSERGLKVTPLDVRYICILPELLAQKGPFRSPLWTPL